MKYIKRIDEIVENEDDYNHNQFLKYRSQIKEDPEKIKLRTESIQFLEWASMSDKFHLNGGEWFKTNGQKISIEDLYYEFKKETI